MSKLIFPAESQGYFSPMQIRQLAERVGLIWMGIFIALKRAGYLFKLPFQDAFGCYI